MGQATPGQRPVAVPRSRYTLVRALLAIAVIAVAGLTVALVIVAGDSDEITGTGAAKPVEIDPRRRLQPGDRPARVGSTPATKTGRRRTPKRRPRRGRPPQRTASVAASVYSPAERLSQARGPLRCCTPGEGATPESPS
jgi:hypothetical protein